jgi:Domain of unknown function (DUF4386)
MSAAVVTERVADASPRFKARVAGFFYLLLVPFGVLSFLARGGIVVKGDAAATATGLLLHETAFRLAVAGDLLVIVSYVVVTALFYELFKPANRSVSLIAAFLSLVGCAIQAFACAFELAPFVALGGEPYSSVFKADQLQALAYMSLKMYSPAYKIGLVFFGLYNMLIGYLILRSIFLPRFLGVFMVIAGLPWLIFLLPQGRSLSPYSVAPASLGEGLLAVWLLVKGVNAQRWKEQASAAATSL